MALGTILSAPSVALAFNKNLLNAALNSVTADELYEHVEVLADDVFEGREAGSRGGRAAAQYLIKQLQQTPLTPAGDDGDYVQTFDDDWRNILALQPGNDPQLENEIIVLGAHYDHVGYGRNNNSYGPAGKIHNGADDNASGVSAMLETIEAFATSGLTTRRSILFAFWDGEERGLVGSKYWLAHPTLPRDRVKVAITVDMVGRLRDKRLSLLGTRSGYGLRRLVGGLVEDDLLLDFSWDLSANSDHWSFIDQEVPVILLHTGEHSDYHRPSDDVEKVNKDGMREVSRYLLALLIKVADADELPKFRPAVRRENTESRRRAAERLLAKMSLDRWPSNQPPPKLGMSWRGDEAEPGIVFLTRVVDGTPAHAAGLKTLDRIQDVNGQPFDDTTAFENTIRELLDANTREFTLLVERAGRVRTVTVKLGSM